MNLNERLLSLVQEALSEFDKPSYKLSSVIRKSIRIARLRNDFDNLYWLELEMVDTRDTWARDHLTSNLKQHYKSDEFDRFNERIHETIIEARTRHNNNDHFYALSVPDIEDMRKTISDELQYFTKGSVHEFNTKEMIRELNMILKRIEHRVFNFLSVSEKQLIDGQRNSDFFEKTRQYVDTKLSLLSVNASEQLTTAYERLSKDDNEARSQSLLSCRRVLKTVADCLYPPLDKPVIGSDGKERKLTDKNFISRLWQFVADRLKGKSSGNLLLSQINDLGSRIDRVYELSSKGVHANVTDYEANQCLIQTYLVLGDILRLSEDDSALLDSQE